MGWIDAGIVGFDTETTGVDVDQDRIVTVAVVRRCGRETAVSSWLVDPGVEIPAAASAVHGITTAHARAHGRAPAPVLEEVASALAGALSRGEPVVAYNASFDLTLLDAELRRHGLATLPERIGRDVRVVVDPLVLDRSLDRYRRGKRRLGDLCAHYGVSTTDLHTADVDVLATLDVLGALAARYPQVADCDLEQLHDRQVEAHRAWAERFNAWRSERGLPGAAEPCWPARAQPRSAAVTVA